MWKIFLFISVVTSYVVYADIVKCPSGEELDNCPSNCTDSCPTRNGEFTNCRRPKRDGCPPPKCVCQFNHRRAENGTCIPTRECPPFECSKPNEKYNPCPPLCPTDDCSQATPNGECPQFGLMLFVTDCSPSCRCQPTYWRKNGVCVPYSECHLTRREMEIYSPTAPIS